MSWYTWIKAKSSLRIDIFLICLSIKLDYLIVVFSESFEINIFKCFAAISRSRCLKFFQTFWLISCVVCWLKVLKCFSVLPLVKRRKGSRLQTISFYMRLNGCLKTLNREINYWHLGTERDCLKFLIILLERELSFHKFCLSFGFFFVNYTYLNESTSETLARCESSCLSNLTVVVCTNFLLKSLFP